MFVSLLYRCVSGTEPVPGWWSGTVPLPALYVSLLYRCVSGTGPVPGWWSGTGVGSVGRLSPRVPRCSRPPSRSSRCRARPRSTRWSPRPLRARFPPSRERPVALPPRKDGVGSSLWEHGAEGGEGEQVWVVGGSEWSESRAPASCQCPAGRSVDVVYTVCWWTCEVELDATRFTDLSSSLDSGFY